MVCCQHCGKKDRRDPAWVMLFSTPSDAVFDIRMEATIECGVSAAADGTRAVRCVGVPCPAQAWAHHERCPPHRPLLPPDPLLQAKKFINKKTVHIRAFHVGANGKATKYAIRDI